MASDTLSTLIDVRNRMLADVSEEARAAAAEQLGAMFTKGEMAGPEHEVALTIFRKLAQDVTAQVRKALAIQIASSPLIPVDLARTIAALPRDTRGSEATAAAAVSPRADVIGRSDTLIGKETGR